MRHYLFSGLCGGLALLGWAFEPASAQTAAAEATPIQRPTRVQPTPAQAPNPTPAPDATPEPAPTPSPDTRTTGQKILDEAKKAADKTKDAAGEAYGKVVGDKRTRDYRSESVATVLANYSPLGIFIPSKLGASATYLANERWNHELDYLAGSFKIPTWIADIGEITDRRASLYSRWYPGNSFSFLFGVSHQSFQVNLGNDLVGRFAPGYPTSIDLLRVESVGAVIGLGNRWQWGSGFTFGVDWIVLNIPVVQTRAETEALKYVQDEGDRRAIERTIDVLKHVPTFALFKLGAGWTF